jgi:propionyl-CoA carboxylase alpha chain
MERREEAIQIMLKAIDGYLVKGVETTLLSVNLCLNTKLFAQFYREKYYSAD